LMGCRSQMPACLGTIVAWGYAGNLGAKVTGPFSVKKW
jgi:hypothetical protein